MTVLFTVLSIASMVLQNCIFNNVCKKELKTNNHIYYFNLFVYGVCILLLGIFAFRDGISWFTVGLGVLFGVVTALSNFYKMLSLASGPMHITLLVTTSSMIIPTMSGVFFGEEFKWKKLLVVFVLIWFIYLSLGKSQDNKINKKWFFCCLATFIFMGTIGVLQKIHQTSAHKGEANAFLLVAFLCSLIFSRIRIKTKLKELRLSKKNLLLAIVCGLCAYGMNFLNLKLSGMLPAQLFFPLVNGSSIVLSSLMSVMIFKEKLSKKQLLGLIGGICSLIAICLVQ